MKRPVPFRQAALLGALNLFCAALHAQTPYKFEYDAEGNPTKRTNPLGQATDTSYDALGRPKQQLAPAPTTGAARPAINYGYDGLDQLASVQDPRSLQTSYTVDGLGRVSALSSPDSGNSSTTYDANGNVKTVTDARGITSTYTYDALNRITAIDYPGWTSTRFYYDAVAGATGRLTKMTDESGNTTYTYDGLGRIASKAQTVISGPYRNTFTVAYSYGNSGSATGKLAAITYPSGNRVNYLYDSDGRVQSVTLNPTNDNGVGTNTGLTIKLLSDIRYTAFGTVGGWTWGNSTQAQPNSYSRTYDLQGRVSSYSLGNALSGGVVRTLAYDDAGRIISATHANAASLNQTYGYDNLDRLTSFVTAATTQSYTLDASGNRSASSFGVGSYTNTVSPTSNRITSATGPGAAKTYSYDNAGNQTSDGTVTFTYSPRGRISSFKYGGTTVYQLHNGIGERVLKSNGGAMYIYDQEGQLLGEYDLATARAYRDTVYLGSQPVAVLAQSVGGTAPNQTTYTNVFYIHTDHLNTPRIVTQASDGAIRWRWDSTDPFGMLPPNENPSNSGTFVFNMRMPGQYYTKESNLFYNYFRDYDPSSGRYVQSDPIGVKGGINTYLYVNGNPIDKIDPDGLQVLRPPLPRNVTRHNEWTDPNRQITREFPTDVDPDTLPRIPQKPKPWCTLRCPSDTPNSCPGTNPPGLPRMSLTGEQCTEVCLPPPFANSDPSGEAPTASVPKQREASRGDWSRMGRLILGR